MSTGQPVPTCLVGNGQENSEEKVIPSVSEGEEFFGKDPTKVDRSATYMARYITKNIVAAGLAKRCLLQLAYVIEKPEPLSIMLNSIPLALVKYQKKNLLRQLKIILTSENCLFWTLWPARV